MAKGCTGDRLLHAHHLVSRRIHSTRWLLETGLACCRACHAWLHLACIDPPAWYCEHGIEWEALKVKAAMSAKGLDMKLVVLDLKVTLSCLQGAVEAHGAPPGVDPGHSATPRPPEPPRGP